MNWRSYQKNYLKSLRRGGRRSFIPSMIFSIMIVLGVITYFMIKHSPRAKEQGAQVQNKAAAVITSPTSVPPREKTTAEIRNTGTPALPDNDVTRWIKHVMDRYRVRYGAVVVLDVKTCAPIAVVSKGANFSAFKAYPAASLIKLVTASAAIELHHIPPYALFYFDSRNASQSIRALTNGYDDGRHKITFSMALAKSNNPVFGKLALYKIGNNNFETYLKRFYFNRSLGPFSVQQSRARVDDNTVDIAQTGAGLNSDTTLSPFHAALIAQAIGNKGRMCVPYEGFGRAKQGTKQVITADTAGELIEMMRLTITKGTSRRAFFNRRGRYILANIQVAGKTGSIHGDDPAGDYEWFIGIAPVKNPQIAVAALVVNGNKWTIKGSYLGAQAFFAYFFPDAAHKLLHER